MRTATIPRFVSDQARRRRLAECIAKMAAAIAAGECTPTRMELLALAQICREHGLLMEAARVRRWMGDDFR